MCQRHFIGKYYEIDKLCIPSILFSKLISSLYLSLDISKHIYTNNNDFSQIKCVNGLSGGEEHNHKKLICIAKIKPLCIEVLW